MKTNLTNKQLILTLALMGLCGSLLFSGCHKNDPAPTPPAPMEDDQTGNLPVIQPDASGEDEPEPGEDGEKTGETDTSETKPGVVEIPGKKDDGAVHVPVTNPQPSRDTKLDAYWNRLDTIVAAAQEYYTENFTKVRLVTKNGLLYNWSADEAVNVAYLCDYEGLDSRYHGLDVEILLIRGSDLSRESGLTIKESDMGLTVFAAQRHPSEDKYLIVSANSAGGVLPASRYQSIVSAYSQAHGTVQQLSPGGAEYERILSFVKLYEASYGKSFVRSIYADDKYALVTLSSQVSTAEVKQYILRKNGNLWEVVMGGIEQEGRVPVAVNRQLPDFNLTMLPSYSVYDYRNSMKATFVDLLPTLINNGYIESSADLYYIGGTDSYCYVVTLEGQRILCTNQNGGWTPVAVSSAAEARNMILQGNKFGPAFIVLDQ